MVVSRGEEGMEIMDDVRRRMVVVVAAAVGEERTTEGLRGVKDDAWIAGKEKGRFGVDGVVGVSIGDGCWSCILIRTIVCLLFSQLNVPGDPDRGSDVDKISN